MRCSRLVLQILSLMALNDTEAGNCADCYTKYCDADRKKGPKTCKACVNQHKSDLAKPKCQDFHDE
jgi:hypothetical protein